MKRRIYTDTSVIGGWLEEEFRDDSIDLFEEFIQGISTMVYSVYTRAELESAPQEVIENLNLIPETHIELLRDTIEIEELANHYISEEVIPVYCEVDALHIAAATVNRVDVVVSCLPALMKIREQAGNFKHIVNLKKIHGFNSVNMKFGYPQLDIRTPKEVVTYED